MNPLLSPLRRRCALFAAGAVLAFAALPVQAQARVDIRHASGTTSVSASPKKVIVLDMTSLDILSTLGVDVAGVPSSRMPRHLARFEDKKYLRAGTLFEPDYEAIHSAAPDLIIVGGRSQSKYKELAKIAPAIDMTGKRGDLLSNLEHNTNLLAGLFGKQAQAKVALDKLKTSIASLKAIAARTSPGLVILTSGGKMSAYGPGSRFGALHDTFGIRPAVANLETKNRHGQSISFEFIQKTNPEWLFVIDRDGAIGRQGSSAQRLLDNELVRQTSAWKKKQVVYLDGANWYVVGAGLTAMQDNVDQLTRALTARR